MITIASWNINSVRIRINHLRKFIGEVKPDIVMLQEIKCSNDDFPDFHSDLDYKASINGQKGKFGVAVLVKKHLTFKKIEPSSEILNKESRVNFIYINELNLNLINVYTPNGNPMDNEEKFEFKISWLEELNKLSKSLMKKNQNIVIAGDFNVLENEKDVNNFEEWRNDALGNIRTRKKFREILSSGLSNVVRLFNAPGNKFSFWDYQRGCWERNDGLLIDHFLLSPKYLENVKNMNFESDYRGLDRPSDHIPLWISLDI
ncbi:MAG: exodeoxyribonuclease III [Alphaproteobacteria bacterium]|tara:strand:- start:113 stop:892 length:780 start_codon:yes stop_codon:yes gene_type:complete